MFEEYRKRMSRYGAYQGEQMRKQTEMVVDATWMNSISTRPVQVKVIDSGLPPTYDSIDDFEEPLWAHFEPHAKYNITKDEIDYYLTFRPGEIHNHPEIKPGTYVAIPNVDDEIEWWLICFIDNDNGLRKAQILRCNWTLKWVANGKIYQCLCCQRYVNSYNSGSWDGRSMTFVDNISGMWCPTNSDINTITYNQRMIISAEGYTPPLVWAISKVENTVPLGLTKLRFTQETFDPTKDNAELGLASYYDNGIEVVAANTIADDFTITYTGTKPSIRVGNSKTFTANLPASNVQDISWTVSDGTNIYNIGYENTTSTYGDYTVATTDRTLLLKVAKNYDIVDTMLTITAHCANGDDADISVEVIS